MANRTDPRVNSGTPDAANDPTATSRRDEGLARRSEVPADHVTHARARESGRSAAKWIGIIVAALIVVLLLAWAFGGAMFSGPEGEGAAVEQVE